MNEEYLSPDYGLINSHRNIPHTEENSPLWSVQYCLRFKRPPMILRERLRHYIAECKISDGLFNQMPEWAYFHRDNYMSPDQLIAFVAHFYLLGDLRSIEQIWSFLKERWFTYDNLTGETNFKRIMQPMAVAFVGACAGSKFWKFILRITCTIACLSPRNETSGKLKAWTCLKTLNMSLGRTDFNYAFNYYFNTYGERSDHPNIIPLTIRQFESR